MCVNEIVFLAVGALFGLSFRLLALRIKVAAAHASLVSDTLGIGLCCRGSNFFSWGLIFRLHDFAVKMSNKWHAPKTRLCSSKAMGTC